MRKGAILPMLVLLEALALALGSLFWFRMRPALLAAYETSGATLHGLPWATRLAFSWGALMGFAVTFGRLDATAFVLYAGSIAWVIGYDTIYAHQDTEDDALIGIKSTARLFAEIGRAHV